MAALSVVLVFTASAASAATPGSAVWKAMAGRAAHSASTLPDGRLLVAGGCAVDGCGRASAETFVVAASGRSAVRGPRLIEVVDVETGRVVDGPALPIAIDALDAVALQDGRIAVIGGQRRPGVGSRGVFVYDPGTNRWTRGPSLGIARFEHVSVALPDGRVFVAGGTTNDRDILDTTEIVDLVRGRVLPGPRLAEPRYKLTGAAIRIADGPIVVAGGGRSVEVLDLARKRSTVFSSFVRRGSFATVNPIGRRHVLVIGGYDDRIAMRRTARLVAMPSPGR